MSVGVKFDTSGFEDALDRWGQGFKDNVRPAAQAGAQVLYDEVLARVPVAEAPHVGKGGKVYQPGTLKAAIYQAYSQDNSSATKATYHVSWNAAKAPHGHLVEFGHIMTRRVVKTASGRYITTGERLPSPVQVAARPFIRPAFDAKVGEMKQAIRTRMEDGMRQFLAGTKS